MSVILPPGWYSTSRFAHSLPRGGLELSQQPCRAGEWQQAVAGRGEVQAKTSFPPQTWGSLFSSVTPPQSLDKFEVT